jgi:hypothetical protein
MGQGSWVNEGSWFMGGSMGDWPWAWRSTVLQGGETFVTSLQEAFAFSEGKRGLCLVLRDYVTRIMQRTMCSGGAVN